MILYAEPSRATLPFRPLFFFLFLFVLGALSVRVSAQQVDEAIREHEERLKDDQMRREDELQRNLPASDIFLQDSSSEAPSFEEQDSQCFDIHTINVVGAHHPEQAAIDDITGKFVNQCLGMASFQKIV